MDTKDLIEYIAKALVDHPDQVRVSEIVGERTSVIELSVVKEDLGKVIGITGQDSWGHPSHPWGCLRQCRETLCFRNH